MEEALMLAYLCEPSMHVQPQIHQADELPAVQALSSSIACSLMRSLAAPGLHVCNDAGFQPEYLGVRQAVRVCWIPSDQQRSAQSTNCDNDLKQSEYTAAFLCMVFEWGNTFIQEECSDAMQARWARQ